MNRNTESENHYIECKDPACGWFPCIDARKKADRIAELEMQINRPEIIDFVKAVQLEAVHQRARWASDHDAGKTDADWFWLIGYLAGKALHNPMPAKCPECGYECICGAWREKQLHRIITIAAASANWHAALCGHTNMRPGIEPPAHAEKDHSTEGDR